MLLREIKATIKLGLIFIFVSSLFFGDAKQIPSYKDDVKGDTLSQKSSLSRPREAAFVNAGRVPGTEVWRIENFKPVRSPENEYGKFYTGDSYIILHTTKNKDTLSWDIHFWLGKETTQDEAGAAAILSVTLDDQLGGNPVQHREVQENESPLFASYFKSGIRYLAGGVNSGFTHVDRNAVQKKLYQVKGKKYVRVKQVDLSIASMNKGDCYILDAGNNIYVYVGPKSKNIEKLKAITAANQVRDQDHGGRSKIHVLDEFTNEADILEFFSVLGNGSPSDVPDETTGEDDQQFEEKEERSVTLYQVSDSSGKLKIQPVTQKPLQQRLLDHNDCFVLETGNANVYVWLGKECNKKERDEAVLRGQEFLKTKKYPSWAALERVIQNGEPSAFIQYFQTWQGVQELHQRIVRSADLE